MAHGPFPIMQRAACVPECMVVEASQKVVNRLSELRGRLRCFSVHVLLEVKLLGLDVLRNEQLNMILGLHRFLNKIRDNRHAAMSQHSVLDKGINLFHPYSWKILYERLCISDFTRNALSIPVPQSTPYARGRKAYGTKRASGRESQPPICCGSIPRY